MISSSSFGFHFSYVYTPFYSDGRWVFDNVGKITSTLQLKVPSGDNRPSSFPSSSKARGGGVADRDRMRRERRMRDLEKSWDIEGDPETNQQIAIMMGEKESKKRKREERKMRAGQPQMSESYLEGGLTKRAREGESILDMKSKIMKGQYFEEEEEEEEEELQDFFTTSDDEHTVTAKEDDDGNDNKWSNIEEEEEEEVVIPPRRSTRERKVVENPIEEEQEDLWSGGDSEEDEDYNNSDMNESDEDYDENEGDGEKKKKVESKSEGIVFKTNKMRKTRLDDDEEDE